MPNYAFTTGRQLPEIENGHIFEMVNFNQLVPHTAIFEGKASLVFKSCNLINCEVPVGSIVESCNNSQISYCSNLHPDWVEKGLPECSENCQHLIDTDEIIVNGITVETVRHYADQGV